MKKIKNFLNKIEESILFRYGKRSWQLLSLVAMGFFVYATIMYLINATPSFRESVSISKIEFDRNEIDDDFDISNDIGQCTLKDYNQEIESLKKIMPESEWYKLGDSVTVRDYRYERAYDVWYGYYDKKVYYNVKEYRKNKDAVPNILQGIYDSKGIDSVQFCEKIKAIKLIKEFVKYADKYKSAELLRRYFRDYIISDGYLTPDVIKKLIKLYKVSNGGIIKFSNPYEEGDDWSEFSNLLNIGRKDSLTDFRFELTENFIEKIKSRFYFKKEEDPRNNLTRYVLGSSLEDSDIKNLTEQFLNNKEIKITSTNLKQIYRKYYRLYKDKVELAEELLEEKKFEKELNREIYFEDGAVSFLSIIGIATILILFSIRQIIKEKNN